MKMKKALCILMVLLMAGVSVFAAGYKIGILAPAVTHGWVAGVAY